MKKILSMAALALTSVVMFTACEDDRDSNPTLTQPTTFVLNKPAVGEGVVDLAQSSVSPFPGRSLRAIPIWKLPL